MPIIEARNVVKRFDGKVILNGVSLTVNEGEIASITGASGSGKTTLLRLLNRLDDPDSGRIFFHRKSIFEYDPLELRRRIGMVFQLPAIFDGTVLDNLTFAFRIRKENIDMEKVKSVLEEAGLPAEYLKKDASKLSVGEKQRLTIARAVLNNSELLLMDEPTSALDMENTLGIELLIKKLNRLERLTFIIVTHNLEQANRLGGKQLRIKDGKLTGEN